MNPRSFVAAGALLLAALGCRDGTDSPTEPRVASPGMAAATALSLWQVSAGEFHTCGVTTDNLAYCWGANGGTLGDGTTVDRLRPAAVLGGLRFRHVSAGDGQHTCGVTTDYRAYCWGLNNAGELGDGTTIKRSLPVPVAGGRQFLQVSAGLGYTCGITYADNRAYCWGGNTFGQLGVGDQVERLTPTAVHGGRRFRQISASGWPGHTCAVTTTNEVYCWGSNRDGELGDSSTAKRRVRPVLVVGGRLFAHVDAGSHFTCAVTTGSRAFCWGYGIDGQLGTGDTRSSSWPRPVARRLSFVRVTAGLRHACGESTTGQAYCWGIGWLGDGSEWKTQLKPVPIGSGLLFAQLSVAPFHTCGKTTAAVAYCWGYNGWGQLGDGTTTSRLLPTGVLGP